MTDEWRLTNINCPHCTKPLEREIEKYSNICLDCNEAQMFPVTDDTDGTSHGVDPIRKDTPFLKDQVSGGTDNPATLPLPEKPKKGLAAYFE